MYVYNIEGWSETPDAPTRNYQKSHSIPLIQQLVQRNNLHDIIILFANTFHDNIIFFANFGEVPPHLSHVKETQVGFLPFKAVGAVGI